jgi:hypothetical protein
MVVGRGAVVEGLNRGQGDPKRKGSIIMPTLIVDGLALEVTDSPTWSPGVQGTAATITAQVHIPASQSITDLDKTNAEVVLDIGDGRTAVGAGMSLVGPARTNGDRAFLRFEGPIVELRS